MNLVYCLLPLILNIAIGFLASIVQKRTNDTFIQKLEGKYPYILIALIPFVWYFILKNHSINHSFFTYRNLLLTIIAIPLIISFSQEIYNKKIIVSKLIIIMKLYKQNIKMS